MQCPACGHVNGEDARFCSQCGTALELRCPSCSAAYEPDDRFCSQCGTSLTGDVPAQATDTAPDDLARYVPPELLRKIRAAQAGQTMRGERRTVTMLFADVQGSTAAAEHLDPEEWAEIMNGAFGRLIAPVYRYEGTLARLQGDAILAFFGAPIAHEDDPARAVRAGLDIIAELEPYQQQVDERYGIDIGVRVGINTGLVVVGEVGSDLRVEYTALGDAINVAARMEQTADPGSVRVTADTLALLGNAFEVEDLGPVDVKGKSEPVAAHRVLRFVEKPNEGRPTTPLVGRDVELGAMTDALRRLDAGVGSIVTLVGEAGVGKSRLLAALREAGDNAGMVADTSGPPGDVGWLRGRARSYERSVPHATFVELLCNWWEGVDRREDCFEQIADAVEVATGTRDLDLAGLLGNLVGTRLPAEQRTLVESLQAPVLHERTTEGVVSYLTAEAKRRPLVVVLDDLHWADAMSLTLVERLMELTESEPLSLVLVMRPNRDDPAWRITEIAARDHGHRHTAIGLEALDDQATDELLERLLGDVRVDDELRGEILQRSRGNPLFVEEIVHSMGDQVGGAREEPLARGHVTVPPSLTGLLTSRLDRLDEASRHVAQVASVIGREFGAGVLEAVVDSPVDLDRRVLELIRRGILEERRRMPEPTYSFRHPLVRETAYSTVLRRTRRDLHGRIARHLDTNVPDAAQEIARHYVEAGDLAAAFPHLITAGLRSIRAMALSDAIRYFSTALEASPADADPDLMLAAHDGLGEAHALVPDLSSASAAYQSLLEYGKRSGQRTMEVTALNRLGFSTAMLSGDFDTALGFLGQARSVAEEIGDDVGLAEYHMNACLVTSLQGNFDQAVEHDDETARIGHIAGNETIRVTGLLRRVWNLIAAGRYEEARAGYGDARELAEEIGNEEVIAVLECTCNAFLHLRDGDLAVALELLRRHLPTVDRYASFYGGASQHRMGECASLAGEVETALSAYAAAERFGRSLSQPFAISAGLAGRARVMATCGMTGQVQELTGQAEELARTPAGEFYSSSAWADLGEARLALGQVEAADAAFREGLDASSVTGVWERPRLLLGLVRVELDREDPSTARIHLEDARQRIAAKAMRVREPILLVLDGAVAAAEGRQDDAAAFFARGERAAAETGLRPTVIEALTRLGELRARAGATTEAADLRDRAATLVTELAGLIVDEDLRASFSRRMTSGSLRRAHHTGGAG